MKEKRITTEHIFCGICLAIMVFFMCSIGLRLLSRQVLVRRLGMDNAFTNLVLFDVTDPNDDGEVESAPPAFIDWREVYPFPDGTVFDEVATWQSEPTITERIAEKVFAAEGKVERYTTDFLIGYRTFTETANGYERLIQWNITPYSEYNTVVELSNGYFTEIVEESDASLTAEPTISLNKYCAEKGINFLYVQLPAKISKYEDTSISGTIDFSNQNADSLLALLANENVDTLDIRELIHDEGLAHHELFYNTDHHWRGETGLWASRHILQFLHEKYGYDIDASILDSSGFTSVDYPKWFLGSQGKKVTLARATPDDFTLLYPDFETELHYEIPDLDIDEVGDFSITYDMTHVAELDYYGYSPYRAYNHSDQPLIKIENELIDNNIKALIIHNSYANCVIPFLALGIEQVDALDLRKFYGSVRTYIEASEPDIVIVMYPPDNVGSIDWDSQRTFDFR